MPLSDIRITGSVGDAIYEILETGSDETREYLKERFLTAAVLSLFEQRKASGLTQAEVAERLGTKQPAISSIEADFSGSFSFRRYVDYALACGTLPLDLSFAPVEGIRRFLLDEPSDAPTAMAYAGWCNHQNRSPGLMPTVQQPVTPVESMALSWQKTVVASLNGDGNRVLFDPGRSSIETGKAA